MRKLPLPFLFCALLTIYLFSGCRTPRNVEYNTSDSIKINTSESLSEQPAPNPYRWRYILGIIISIVLFVVGMYFTLWRTKPIISLISFVKKLF
ncbi:MAG: hypothetical protein LBS54_08545 [Dysgonamonadaceae bacterium]|nr:hypothetical protein [Dysgonamonadaceae bacterium]